MYIYILWCFDKKTALQLSHFHTENSVSVMIYNEGKYKKSSRTVIIIFTIAV